MRFEHRLIVLAGPLRPIVRFAYATTKHGDGRTFPFTAEIEQILRDQLAIHEQMKKFKRVVPFVFHRDAERIRELMPFDDGGLGVDSLLTDMAPPPDS